MSGPAQSSPPPRELRAAPPSSTTLRRLFLMLFLRGRSSRGLNRDKAPKSIGEKLAFVLMVYGAFGLISLSLLGQPVFALSISMHAATFIFLGMFVASSAGDVLFNKEESEILLHRPISPKSLLWAKVRVLAEVSLWIGLAFNLASLLVGIVASDGGWLFPAAHFLSTALEALFCTSCVVMVYQLCLRWFGREKLDGLLTTAQVLFAVGAVFAGQIGPQLVHSLGGKTSINVDAWWALLLPPAWFAGFDDVIAGHAGSGSWLLAGMSLAGTALMLWLAFGRLAQSYQTGLQTLSETVARPIARPRNRGSWLDLLLSAPPMRWWLRDPVSRASFKLTVAYLLRDRDVKLRVYPGIAPLFAIPFIFLFQERGHTGVGGSGFAVAFAGTYLGLAPFLGLTLLQFSQQWQASDIFRAAPLPGPAALSGGARRALLLFFIVPLLTIFAVLTWVLGGDFARLVLLVPGLIVVPLLALLPCRKGRGVPLSLPGDDAKAAGRSLYMISAMVLSGAIGGVGSLAWKQGWFIWFVLVELLVVGISYILLRRSIYATKWPGFE